MAIDPEFLACLKQQISTADPDPTGAPNAFAECALGAPVKQLVRLESQNRMVQSPSGEERMSNTLMIAANEITDRSVVWLPGKDDTDAAQSVPVQMVEIAVDEDGDPHHYEVSL